MPAAIAVAKRVLKPFVPRSWIMDRQMRRAMEGAELELPLAPLMCERDALAVDVGANNGLYTWQMDRASRAVLAFEPYPALADRLRAEFGPKVKVEAVALSDSEGQAELAVPQHGGGDLPSRNTLEREVNTEFNRRTLTVPVRRLDSYGLENVAFLKVHVEGHEYPALVGAERTLATSRPTILVGSEERHVPGARERIRAFLEGMGYAGWFIDHGRLRPIADFQPEVHQRRELAKPPGAGSFTPDYIHNFIFVHPQRAAVMDRLRAKLG
ncbi:FkbM family methyltransferase [Indioceanicola profundi]|uniref:FkbM family methyltransferase n=1 Tax=Indioceanicola profundi TaxID=2220096 RepID=UPI0013C45F2A|nr:FkbM family methyltransferase [Indioceanicola profundi]